MAWMMPILVLSGLVVLGNALLNALGRYAVPAGAQAVVPLFAIGALLAFGRSHGAVVAVLGMFAGQVANLLIVTKLLAREGISLPLTPVRAFPDGRTFLGQYLPLVAAALFTNLWVPVSTAMVSALPEGSVAAFGLGTKAVLFITGTIGSGIATVILPYFSRILARDRMVDVSRELSFFLTAAAAIAIPAGIVLYLASEPVVRLVFEGGRLRPDEAREVARVMAYGILQLPFFTVNAVLLRYLIAARRSG